MFIKNLIREDENHNKNDEELMIDRDNFFKNEKVQIDANTQNNTNMKSNNKMHTNILTNSLINNTQNSVENYNSFGGINQTFQTFQSINF